MAEYNSAYTGKEIDERLGKVPGLETSVSQLSFQIAEKVTREEMEAYIEQTILGGAW